MACMLRSAIQLPPSSYPLYDSISDDIVDNGKLSQLQLESVLYACTKHLNFLPSGERMAPSVFSPPCSCLGNPSAPCQSHLNWETGSVCSHGHCEGSRRVTLK